MTSVQLFSLSLLCLNLASCNYNNVKEAEGAGVNFSEESVEMPDFKMVNAAVMVPRCLGCHSGATGNQGGVNLEDYATVRSLRQRIVIRSIEKKDMPPSRPLSAIEIRILQNWIDQGAPENVIANGEKPDPTLGQGANDWNKVKDKIFARKCLGCHNSDKRDGDLSLEDIKEVRAKRKEIFDRAIATGNMPPPPIASLTKKERNVLWQWFDTGMPE